MNQGQILLAFSGGPKMAAPVTGASAVLSGVANALISWTNPNDVMYDTVTIQRSISGGAYADLVTPAKGTTSYTDSPGNSLDAAYRIVAKRAGWTDSALVTAGTVRTQPATTSPQSISAQNPGQITYNANGPGHGNISSYQVALSTDYGANYGAATGSGADPSHVFTGIGHGLGVYVISRTIDGFGQASAWSAPLGVVSVNDVTPPTAPVPSIYSLGGSQVEVQYQAWSDSQSGIASGAVQASYNGGGWQTVYTIPSYLLGTQNTFADDVTGRGVRGQTASYRLVTSDNVGNQAISGGSTPVQLKPQGSYILYPVSSRTFATNGTFRSVGPNGDQLICGIQAALTNYGCWFYGTQLADLCRGWAPDSVNILMQKTPGGSSGDIYMCAHDQTAQAGNPNFFGLQYAGALPSSGYLQPVISNTFYGGFASGAYRGMATADNQPTPFRTLYGHSEDTYSGALTVTFN